MGALLLATVDNSGQYKINLDKFRCDAIGRFRFV